MMILKRYMSAIYIVYQPRNGSRYTKVQRWKLKKYGRMDVD